MDYVNRLEHYDADELAKIAIGEPYCLYNEAFEMYRKAEMFEQAVDVLLDNIESIDKATDFASKLGDNPVVWTKVGKSMLDTGLTEQCIDAFIKATNS
jgi:clathrin heavy chain